MSRARVLTGGELLALRIEQFGLSQSELAKKLDASTGAVSRWISGERTPSLAMAVRLERELAIPVESWISSRTGTDG